MLELIMFYDLFLNQNLGIKISEENPSVILIIHPFYTNVAEKKSNYRYATQSYLDTIHSFIQENLEEKKKLIIFQEEKEFEKLGVQLSELSNYDIWYVKTVTGEATPILKDGWKEFSKVLLKNDIKSITISGLFLVNKSIEHTLEDYEGKYDKEGILPEFIKNRELYIKKFAIASKWLNKNFVPTGCVGFAIMNLLKYGIDVDISEQTAPCSKYKILTHRKSG